MKRIYRVAALIPPLLPGLLLVLLALHPSVTRAASASITVATNRILIIEQSSTRGDREMRRSGKTQPVKMRMFSGFAPGLHRRAS